MHTDGLTLKQIENWPAEGQAHRQDEPRIA